MLKRALCFFLLKSCGPPNDIITFFGPWLKKFAGPSTLTSLGLAFALGLVTHSMDMPNAYGLISAAMPPTVFAA